MGKNISQLKGLKDKTGHGFTLVEVLVATSILAMVLICLAGSFSLAVKGSAIIYENQYRNRGIYTVFGKLGSELRNSCIYSRVKFTGDKEHITFFTRKTEREARKLKKISYWREGDVLKCREENILDGAGEEDTILESVKNVVFHYAVGDEYAGYGWVEVYKPQNGLPKAVKLDITVGSDGKETTYSKLFYIPAGGYDKE